MGGEEKPTSGPVSLAGLIKRQPIRNKGNKSWRPLQLSDFGDDENNNDADESDHDDFASFTSDFNQKLELRPNRSVSSQVRASPFDLRPLQTNMNFNEAINPSPLSQRLSIASDHRSPAEFSSGYPRVSDEDISPTDTRHGVVDEYARLFGKTLPDPVHLPASVGDFDGQVVFIGHPNRDVSAHQWVAEMFQWSNIGLYSHNRRRIEGSLALDRLRGSIIPHNTVHYFKAVAEQREKQVQSASRLRAQEASSENRTRALRRPTLTESDHFASLSSASGSTSEQLPTLNSLRTLPSDRANIATPASRTITTKALEDPFVTPARHPHPAVPAPFNFTRGLNGTLGSMDFTYEFPVKSMTQRGLSSQSPSRVDYKKQYFIQREQERLEAMRRGVVLQDDRSSSSLKVRTGMEDALSFSARRPGTGRMHVPLSPEDAHDRQKLKDKLGELCDSARRESHPVIIPRPHLHQDPAKTLQPPPGFTIANPTRVASKLNANAAPYTHVPSHDVSEASESEATAVNAQPPASLRFSDPDGLRQKPVPEIANGLNHQKPTPQNFRGPFFTDQRPSSLNPTASLALPSEEEGKLKNWFTDGQRPARQQEFCRKIMDTANASFQLRPGHNFGAIGESRTKHHGTLVNTPIFVRLYENLYEYMEESKAGGGKDYFIRSWKTSEARDQGPNGNMNYLALSLGPDHATRKRSFSPQQFRKPNMSYSNAAGPAWNTFGQPSTWMRKDSRGNTADGGFGGSYLGRY
jgi:hypothetical protein